MKTHNNRYCASAFPSLTDALPHPPTQTSHLLPHNNTNTPLPYRVRPSKCLQCHIQYKHVLLYSQKPSNATKLHSKTQTSHRKQSIRVNFVWFVADGQCIHRTVTHNTTRHPPPHTHWPSPPARPALSLLRVFPTSCSFSSAACLHWVSFPSHPAFEEL